MGPWVVEACLADIGGGEGGRGYEKGWARLCPAGITPRVAECSVRGDSGCGHSQSQTWCGGEVIFIFALLQAAWEERGGALPLLLMPVVGLSPSLTSDV